MKQIILSHFKWVQSYTVLSLGRDGNKLEEADNQHPDGNELVDKRGQVYVQEQRGDPFIVSWDSQ